jgi:hypothetical protein
MFSLTNPLISVINTPAACSCLPPETPSHPRGVQALNRSEQWTLHETPPAPLSGFALHDGRHNQTRSQTAVGVDAASLRDAPPAWSGQLPYGGLPLAFFF